MLSAAIADFLVAKSEQSDRPESLLRAVMAALTNFFSIRGRRNPFNQELLNLVKALVKHSTKRPSGRTKVMPMEPLSRLFESWGENNTLTLSQLRQKALTLLTMACMARPSDLAPKVGFVRSQLSFRDTSVTVLFFGIKNDTNRQGFEVRVDGTESNADPVKCLKHYCDRTAEHAKEANDAVFLTLTPPFKALNAQSVAQILRKSISDAGLPPDQYTAKSFRPSAATAAIASGCNPNITRLRGRWKTESVFFNHYVYPVTEQTNMTHEIMTSNIMLDK